MRLFRRGRRRRWRRAPLTGQGWLLVVAIVAFLAAGVLALSPSGTDAGVISAVHIAKRSW